MIGLCVPGFSEPGKVKKVIGWVTGVFGFCTRNSAESPVKGLTDEILKKLKWRGSLFSIEGTECLNLLFSNNKGQIALNCPSFNLSIKALLFESETLPFCNLQLLFS